MLQKMASLRKARIKVHRTMLHSSTCVTNVRNSAKHLLDCEQACATTHDASSPISPSEEILLLLLSSMHSSSFHPVYAGVTGLNSPAAGFSPFPSPPGALAAAGVVAAAAPNFLLLFIVPNALAAGFPKAGLAPLGVGLEAGCENLQSAKNEHTILAEVHNTRSPLVHLSPNRQGLSVFLSSSGPSIKDRPDTTTSKSFSPSSLSDMPESAVGGLIETDTAGLASAFCRAVSAGGGMAFPWESSCRN